MSLRFSQTPRIVKLLLAVTLVVPLVIPVNFVLINPGEGTPLFPKMLTIASPTSESSKSWKSYPANGQMYLLSIWVTNPESKIFGHQVLTCWAQRDCVVIPRSVVYEKNTDDKAEQAVGKKEMKQSQSAALTATKGLFKKYYPNIDLTDLKDSHLKISLRNTGGPSGGLIFSLGISELLSPDDLLQGRKIAATGTISAKGKVGAIGGVEEKIVAARKAKAEIIFISKENCSEIPDSVSGLRVIAVSTLDQAYKALREPKISNFQGVQGCTNLDS
jgi:PDZ domain-containing protein